jgi:hypothetical protein
MQPGKPEETPSRDDTVAGVVARQAVYSSAHLHSLATLASASARRCFLRGAQASAGIDHEHIVTSSRFPFLEIFPHELDPIRD